MEQRFQCLCQIFCSLLNFSVRNFSFPKSTPFYPTICNLFKMKSWEFCYWLQSSCVFPLKVWLLLNFFSCIAIVQPHWKSFTEHPRFGTIYPAEELLLSTASSHCCLQGYEVKVYIFIPISSPFSPLLADVEKSISLLLTSGFISPLWF